MKLKIIFFPLTLILTFAIFVLMIKPEWESLGSNKAQLETLSTQHKKLQDGKQNLQSAYSEYENLDENDKLLINNAMPSHKNNDDFVGEIYKNMEGSGVFLVGTTLKESKDQNSEQTACAVNAAESVVMDPDGTLTTDQVVAKPYCPPEKVTTDAKVDVIGNYVNNIKTFVSLLDKQNRLVIPTMLTLEAFQESDEDGSEVNGDLVKGAMQFEFFNREMDEGMVLSNMAESSDRILDSLLSGKVNTQAIQTFKDSITSEVFKPVTAEGYGKEDLFAR